MFKLFNQCNAGRETLNENIEITLGYYLKTVLFQQYCLIIFNAQWNKATGKQAFVLYAASQFAIQTNNCNLPGEKITTLIARHRFVFVISAVLIVLHSWFQIIAFILKHWTLSAPDMAKQCYQASCLNLSVRRCQRLDLGIF